MKTPEEKLCSRWWRLWHSSWILFSILSAGVLTSIGFIIIATKSKKRQFIIASIGWGIYTIAIFTSVSVIDSGTKENPADSIAYDVQSAVLVFAWLAGMIHSCMVNRSWLKWRAGHVKNMPWYGQAQLTSDAFRQSEDPLGDAVHGYGQQPTQQSASPANYAQTPAATTGQSSLSQLQPLAGVPILPHFAHGVPLQSTATAAATGQEHPSVSSKRGPVVDLNRASSEELQHALGLPGEVAGSIVAQRTAIGGFSSPDQLLQLGLVQPHVFMGLRDQMKTSTPAGHGSPPPASGGRRTLDLS